MRHYDWTSEFREIYQHGLKAYRHGNTRPGMLFDPAQKAALATIGCSTQELFDFVEDCVQCGEPDYEFALLVTAVRRDYFLTVQQGTPSSRVLDMNQLPSKQAAVAGIAWLPRLIEKARAKLRGEMPPELMYGCGGDRPFLESVNVHPADFLRLVWAAGEDSERIVKTVQESMRSGVAS